MKPGQALLALALAAAPAPARAQTIDRSNGEAGAPILQLTTTPRAAALGGALAAAAGVTSIFANPAGAEASGGAASFSAGVRGRLSSKLVVGASVQYLGGQVDVGGFGAPLPRTVRAGAELRPLGSGHERVHLLLAADYAAVRGAPGRVG